MRSRMAGCWPMAVLLLPLALLAYDTSGTRAPIDTAIPDHPHSNTRRRVRSQRRQLRVATKTIY